MSDAPLHEPPLQGARWSRPWHLYFNGLKNWVTGLISAIKFKELSDVPQSYTGQAGKVVKVKSDETGLEFGTSGGGASVHNDLTSIQGGTSTERYHLSSADYTELTGFANGGTTTHTDLDAEKSFSESHRANSLIHFEQADIDHTGINNIGIYTHDEIDIHIDRVDNPHQVTADQVLPSQTSNSGKYLTTNGTTASWGTVSAGVTDHTLLTNIGTNTHAQIDTHISNTSNPHSVTANQVLPSQGGNSGKYLTTDGTNTSWATVSAGISGSGTTNTIPLWSGASTLSDSALTQSSGNVTCSGDFGVSSGKVFKIGSTNVIDLSGTRNYYGGGAIVGGGTDNLIIGGLSGKAGGTWSYNVGLGYRVFEAITDGSENVSIGWGSMVKCTTGAGNVAIAVSGMNALTTGTGNVGVGTGGLQSVTSGSYNFGLGNDALYGVLTTTGNVGIGRQAGRYLTGSDNICIGQQSGWGLRSSNASIAIGFQSIYGGSGSYQTAIGDSSGPASGTASNSVYLSYTSGFRHAGGSKCVFIGYEAGLGSGSYTISNTIVLGASCLGTTNPASDRLYIDTRSSVGATTLIYGEFDNEIIKINGRLATRKQSITLGAGATTFAVNSNGIILTGDAGTNTISTITGGVENMILVIKFVDSNVTISKDSTTTANTVHMQATLNGSANTILTLWFDGNKWFELGRSLN